MDAALHQEVLQRLTEPVIIADASGTIRYVNESAGHLLEWAPEELLGRPLAVIIPRGMRGRHQTGFERYRATRVPRVLGKTIRVPVLRRGGGEIRVELTIDTIGSGSQEHFAARFREVAGRQAARRSDPTPLLLKALSGAAEALRAACEPERVPARIAELLSTHFGAVLARVWRFDPDSGWLSQPPRTRQRIDAPEPLRTDLELATDPFVVAEVGRTLRPFVRNQLAGAPGWDPGWLGRERLDAVAVLPLTLGGRLLGVFAYFSADPISDELAQLLGLFASLASSALDQAAQEELRRRERELTREIEIVSSLPDQLVKVPTIDAALERILEAGLEILSLDQALLAVPLRHAAGFEVRVCAGYGTSIRGYQVPPGGMFDELCATGEIRMVTDYSQFPSALPPLRQRGVRAALAAPVPGTRTAAGVLQLDSKRSDRSFKPKDRRVIHWMAGLTSLALRPATTNDSASTSTE